MQSSILLSSPQTLLLEPAGVPKLCVDHSDPCKTSALCYMPIDPESIRLGSQGGCLH